VTVTVTDLFCGTGGSGLGLISADQGDGDAGRSYRRRRARRSDPRCTGNAKRDADLRAALDAGIEHVVVDGPDDVDQGEVYDLGAVSAPPTCRARPR